MALGACAIVGPRASSPGKLTRIRRVKQVAMKQFCILATLLAVALADPTVYFKETFEDGQLHLLEKILEVKVCVLNKSSAFS